VEFDVLIEIPRGSRNKYEMDHASGLISLDLTLFTATQYPAGYVLRGQRCPFAASGLYVKAPIPVTARPTMSVCMVSVPSKVWMASRSTMCRMTW
jgi:inorganic pyrophosphatase